MDKLEKMWVPALIGGVLLGVGSALPIVYYLNCACCGVVIGGGLLASYLYLKDRPAHLPSADYGEGALLGFLTGVIGSLTWTFVATVLQYIQVQLGITMQQWSEVEEALSDPEIPPIVREVLERMMGGDGFNFLFVITMLFSTFIISIIFATLGSILGVALFQRRRPPQLPTQEIVPPQPPTPPTPPPPPD
ncbi:MAG: hypothetical protein ACRD1R_07045 [Acidobacteriota bacterium]